jgi:hypothetical protein
MSRIVEAFVRPRWQITAIDEFIISFTIIGVVLLILAITWAGLYIVSVAKIRQVEAARERTRISENQAKREYYEKELAAMRDRSSRYQFGLMGPEAIQARIIYFEALLEKLEKEAAQRS